MATKLKKKGVRWAYTFSELKRAIESQHREKSLREIARSLSVSHGVIQRILQGIEPKAFYIRNRLLLPVTIPVAVCPYCGHPPLSKHHRCVGAEPKPRKPAKSARRKRLIHDERWRQACARMRRVRR